MWHIFFIVINLKQEVMDKQPTTQQFIYLNSDGQTPNSCYPVTIYRESFNKEGDDGARWLEERFSANNWTNAWRWGIYPFHHFHSNTHEVLGVFSGSASIRFGGEQGEEHPVNAGDVIIIPAGVAHKCISHSEEFLVVGAYPGGTEPDLIKSGEAGNDMTTIAGNIKAVPFPEADPLLGKNEGIIKSWKDEKINPIFSQLAEGK
jgi:uncharacterized protein YjlB